MDNDQTVYDVRKLLFILILNANDDPNNKYKAIAELHSIEDKFQSFDEEESEKLIFEIFSSVADYSIAFCKLDEKFKDDDTVYSENDKEYYYLD